MATKKLQIIDALIKQAENADMLDGKHADEFAAAADVEALETKVGDTAVATQISDAVDALESQINAKADSDHTHDDRYYTESEIDSKLSGKSDSSHTHSSYVNQNAFSNVTVGSTTIAADSTTDTLTLVAGDNVAITLDTSNDKVTIAATDTVYTHPTSGITAGTYKSVTVNAQGHVTAGSNPTTLSGYGITDAATKTELNEVSTLVGTTAVSTQISNAINAIDYPVDSVNGKTGVVTLTFSDVGAAESSHTQAASTITAGTFAGAVVAQTSSQTPGTSLLRNSKLVTADTDPSNNGEIYWTYE